MPITRHAWTLAALLVCGLGVNAASAQRRAPQDRLADLESLDCEFSAYTTVTWNDRMPEVVSGATQLSMRFEDISVEDGSAEVARVSSASFGARHINVQLAGTSLHFLAVDSSGAVYITTVFVDASPGGVWKAVHTRHEFTEVSLPGYTSRPEQYYGVCRADGNGP